MALAKELSRSIEGKTEVGIQDNSISYKILSNPMDATKWKPGVGTAINERPFVLFLLIVLVLAVIGSLLALVASYTRLAFLLTDLVFLSAFHSAPNSSTIKELYLGIVISQPPDDLNGHDSRILSRAIMKYSSRPWTQLIFGFLFAAIIFLPDRLFFILALFLLFTGVMYLGRKYSVSKGVFGSVPS